MSDINDLVGIFHTDGPSMCSVCMVREGRDGEEFIPAHAGCYQAALDIVMIEATALGYRKALDAARDAVAAVGVIKDTSHDMRVQALAAIDALREEQAPPPLPPSVGVPIKPMWPLREEQK